MVFTRMIIYANSDLDFGSYFLENDWGSSLSGR